MLPLSGFEKSMEEFLYGAYPVLCMEGYILYDGNGSYMPKLHSKCPYFLISMNGNMLE